MKPASIFGMIFRAWGFQPYNIKTYGLRIDGVRIPDLQEFSTIGAANKEQIFQLKCVCGTIMNGTITSFIKSKADCGCYCQTCFGRYDPTISMTYNGIGDGEILSREEIVTALTNSNYDDVSVDAEDDPAFATAKCGNCGAHVMGDYRVMLGTECNVCKQFTESNKLKHNTEVGAQPAFHQFISIITKLGISNRLGFTWGKDQASQFINMRRPMKFVCNKNNSHIAKLVPIEVIKLLLKSNPQEYIACSCDEHTCNITQRLLKEGDSSMKVNNNSDVTDNVDIINSRDAHIIDEHTRLGDEGGDLIEIAPDEALDVELDEDGVYTYSADDIVEDTDKVVIEHADESYYADAEVPGPKYGKEIAEEILNKPLSDTLVTEVVEEVETEVNDVDSDMEDLPDDIDGIDEDDVVEEDEPENEEMSLAEVDDHESGRGFSEEGKKLVGDMIDHEIEHADDDETPALDALDVPEKIAEEVKPGRGETTLFVHIDEAPFIPTPDSEAVITTTESEEIMIVDATAIPSVFDWDDDDEALKSDVLFSGDDIDIDEIYEETMREANAAVGDLNESEVANEESFNKTLGYDTDEYVIGSDIATEEPPAPEPKEELIPTNTSVFDDW